MFFGDKSIFAIEYNISYNNDSIILGNFCYWINNILIGNYLELTYLNDVLLFYPLIINDIGNRLYDRNLKGKSWADIYEEIRKRIYDDESEKYEGCPARFDITIKVEALLDFNVYYIEDSKYGHIIYSNEFNQINEFTVKKGFVDEVLYLSYQSFLKII